MEENQKNSERAILKEDELFELARKILSKRKLIIRNTIIGMVLGVAFALGVQKTWTSEVVLAPEISGEGGLSGSVSSLASMVGVNLGNMGTDALYPELYPQIIGSKPFIVGLFDVPVTTLEGEKYPTLYSYLKTGQHMGWYQYPKHWIQSCINSIRQKVRPDKFNGNPDQVDPFYLSKEQDMAYVSLSQSIISSSVNKKDQIITLSVTTQDPLVSAMLVDTVRVRLQAAITDYRTRKARHDMEYAEKLMNESRADYKRWQQKYAAFSDSHFNSILKSVSSEQDELENQMSLSYEVYSQMVQQYYAAKARVQERTPSFTTIEPASVAQIPSSIPKVVVVFLWTFLFFAISVTWVCTADTLKNWRAKLHTAA